MQRPDTRFAAAPSHAAPASRPLTNTAIQSLPRTDFPHSLPPRTPSVRQFPCPSESRGTPGQRHRCCRLTPDLNSQGNNDETLDQADGRGHRSGRLCADSTAGPGRLQRGTGKGLHTGRLPPRGGGRAPEDRLQGRRTVQHRVHHWIVRVRVVGPDRPRRRQHTFRLGIRHPARRWHGTRQFRRARASDGQLLHGHLDANRTRTPTRSTTGDCPG